MADSVNTRVVALEIIIQVNDNKEFSHVVINDALSKYQYLDKTQRSFISRLALGSIEKKIELDYILDMFSKTPVTKMKPLIRNLMEMSVYQLLYMDNVPDSAVCNEAVKIAGKRGFVNLKGFVNGVLRNIARNKDNIVYPDKTEDLVKYLSVKYSMPQWIIEMWNKEYEYDVIEDILKGMECDKKTYIRCNTSKISVDGLRAQFEKENVTCGNTDNLSYAMEINGYDYLAGLDSFNDGLFQIQDISSMYQGEAAAPKADNLVIDVCAAPGGKSVNAALKMLEDAADNNTNCTGKVIARDLTDYKADLIWQNVDRLSLEEYIDVQVHDACEKDDSLVGMADVVIADLPCSGLGIIGRKPDIKNRITMKDCEELAALQRKILSVVNEYVKPGGVLVYSTCTINSLENEGNAGWFSDNFDFEREGDYGQILPSKNGITDGFFIAKFRKKL